MSTARSNRIPAAIAPFLELPPELSLVLLTGTLSCSPNWLTALYVGSVLGTGPGAEAGMQQRGVTFVSWMRDLSFWTDEIRRTTGIDVTKLPQQGLFTFLDYLDRRNNIETADQLSNALSAIKTTLSGESSESNRKTIVVLDNPDILLATQSTSAHELNKFILELRTLAHSMIISCSADLPLVAAADQSTTSNPTPMEIDTAAFLMQQAHAAQLIMSVHELSSGAARDVSGALRISRGGGVELEETTTLDIPEKEMLYLTQRDGSVRVFGRGEGNT